MTPVQQIARANSSGDAFGNFGSNVTAGNSLIAVVAHRSTASVLAGSVLQNANVLVKGPSASISGITVEIWYLHNVAGGSATTEVATNDGTPVSYNMQEWSGLTNAAPESTNTNSGTGTIVTTNTATPVATLNVLIAGGAWTADDYSSGPTNSFTRLTQIGVSNVWQEAAYLSQGAAASGSTGWGLTASINWVGVIASFAVPSTNFALTGQSATSSAGSVTPSLNKALNGQVATSSAGSLTVSSGKPLIGQLATASAGVVGPNLTIALVGRSATVSAGSISAGSGVTLTGQVLTSHAGQPIPNITIPLTGASVTVSAGRVWPPLISDLFYAIRYPFKQFQIWWTNQ